MACERGGPPDLASPDNRNDTMEYWRSRAITAEQKVLEFHAQISTLGVDAQNLAGRVQAKAQARCVVLEAQLAKLEAGMNEARVQAFEEAIRLIDTHAKSDHDTWLCRRLREMQLKVQR